jgi:hypothetical protein
MKELQLLRLLWLLLTPRCAARLLVSLLLMVTVLLLLLSRGARRSLLLLTIGVPGHVGSNGAGREIQRQRLQL